MTASTESTRFVSVAEHSLCDPELADNELRMWLVCWTLADWETGMMQEPMAKIAQRLGRRRGWVWQMLRRLVKKGKLQPMATQDSDGKCDGVTGRYRTNAYRVENPLDGYERRPREPVYQNAYTETDSEPESQPVYPNAHTEAPCEPETPTVCANGYTSVYPNARTSVYPNARTDRVPKRAHSLSTPESGSRTTTADQILLLLLGVFPEAEAEQIVRWAEWRAYSTVDARAKIDGLKAAMAAGNIDNPQGLLRAALKGDFVPAGPKATDREKADTSREAQDRVWAEQKAKRQANDARPDKATADQQKSRIADIRDQLAGKAAGAALDEAFDVNQGRADDDAPQTPDTAGERSES